MTRRATVLDALEPAAVASLSRGTFTKLGIRPGDMVRVTTRRGTVELNSRQDDGIPDGVVFIPFAYVEAAANILTNPALDPFGNIPDLSFALRRWRLPTRGWKRRNSEIAQFAAPTGRFHLIYSYRILSHASRPVAEGGVYQRLQTRGGERWPGHHRGSEMRSPGPGGLRPGMVARQVALPRGLSPVGPSAASALLLRTTGVGLRDVFEDEELFAGLDETELATREVLDGTRVFLESLGLFAEPGVFRTHVDQRLLQRAILLALLQHFEQALLTDQGVEDQHAPDEDEQVLYGAAAAAALVGSVALAGVEVLLHDAVYRNALTRSWRWVVAE